MTVAVSTELNNARLSATVTSMDQGGTGNAAILIYSGTQPAAGATATGTLLVTIILARPSSVLTSGALVLSGNTAAGELIVNSGTAAWARFNAANGDWMMDTDVSVTGGTGAVQLPSLILYAGGRCPLSTSSIG